METFANNYWTKESNNGLVEILTNVTEDTQYYLEKYGENAIYYHVYPWKPTPEWEVAWTCPARTSNCHTSHNANAVQDG